MSETQEMDSEVKEVVSTIDAMRRQANINGVATSFVKHHVDPENADAIRSQQVNYTTAELQWKLDYVARYRMMKKSLVASGENEENQQQLMEKDVQENEEGDDIDGVVWNQESNADILDNEDLDGILFVSYQTNQNIAVDDDDDDIDGVAVDLTHYDTFQLVVTVNVQCNVAEDNEDLDGIPI